MSDMGWIGVDFDGTLAHYDHWRGETHTGAPIAPMVERVKRWLAEGRQVRIFTARIYEPVDIGGLHMEPMRKSEARAVIEAWCLEHIGQVLPVTNIKDYGMIELWDDRAVQVMANTGIPVGQSTRGLD